MSLLTGDRKRGHPSRLRGGPGSHPCMMNHLRNTANIPLGVLEEVIDCGKELLETVKCCMRDVRCGNGEKCSVKYPPC